MAANREWDVGLHTLSQELDASTEALRCQVELANHLATHLAELHSEHVKLGTQLWGIVGSTGETCCSTGSIACLPKALDNKRVMKPDSLTSDDTLAREVSWWTNEAVQVQNSSHVHLQAHMNGCQASEEDTKDEFQPQTNACGTQNHEITDLHPKTLERRVSEKLGHQGLVESGSDLEARAFKDRSISKTSTAVEDLRTSFASEDTSNSVSTGATKRVSAILNFSSNPARVNKTSLEAHGVKLARSSRWVVNPEHSRALERWDIITMSSLFFVAMVTPVQISMTDCVVECPVLFAMNTVVDAVFLADLVLQFFLMYPKKTNFGQALEHRHGLIVKNYLRGWFTIDLLSIFPFDLISVFSDNEEMSKMKAVKVIRLMRLLKLVRVLKASRLFRRFEVRMSFTYQRLALLKFFIVLAALTHWMACLWALTLMLVDKDGGVPRWVDVFDDEEANVMTKTRDSMWKIYIACLYFTSYTITSVGYGDIGPSNIVERVVCTVMVLLSGISWAMVLGQVCGIVGNMDADEQYFRKTMDELNFMMDDRQLPKMMRRRLRGFFIANKLAQRHKHQRQIVESMSPGLQGEVVMEMNRVWLSKVSFLNAFVEETRALGNRFLFQAGSLDEEHVHSFLADVARGLRHMMYAQSETFGMYQVLYILNQGLVGRRNKIHRSGAVWGTDFLLSDQSLLQSPRCVALTYVGVLIIDREEFFDILSKYNNECMEIQRRVRKYVCWLAVQRGIMKEARERRNHASRTKYGKNSPKHRPAYNSSATNRFTPEETARGRGSMKKSF